MFDAIHPVATAHRSRGTLVLACVTAVLLSTAARAGASTDVTLGQVASASTATGSSSGAAAIQVASATGSPSYVFPAGGGYVHAWQVQDDAQAGQVALLILAPSSGGGYTVAGETALQTATPGTLNSFTAPFLYGAAGDLVGLSSTGPPLTFTGNAGDQTASLSAAYPPLGGALTVGSTQPASDVNLSATVTPPADLSVGSDFLGVVPPEAQPAALPGSAATLPQTGFDFDVANAGPNEADAVTLTITVAPAAALTAALYGPVSTSHTAAAEFATPQPADCTTTASGLTCTIAHLAPGTEVGYEVATGVVPAGNYTATATISGGTIGDPACPVATCDPNLANNTISQTNPAVGDTLAITLTPYAAPRLTALRVVLTRHHSVKIEDQQTAPPNSLVTRTVFILSKKEAARHHSTRLVKVATFTSPAITLTPQTTSTLTTAQTIGLLQSIHRRSLTPGRYELSATPGYVDLPRGALTVTSTNPVTRTIGPGACVNAPEPCPPNLAVVTRGPTVTVGFTVKATR